MNILVLCTGNSARSILLESLFNHRSEGRVSAWSAGSKPAGQVHPQSLRLLSGKGFPTDNLTSQSWDDFALPDAPRMDAVITVCGSAAAEECPYWPGAPIRAHWGIEDPAAAAPADQPNAFEEAFRRLQSKAEAFLSERFEDMDERDLAAHLKTAGQK